MHELQQAVAIKRALIQSRQMLDPSPCENKDFGILAGVIDEEFGSQSFTPVELVKRIDLRLVRLRDAWQKALVQVTDAITDSQMELSKVRALLARHRNAGSSCMSSFQMQELQAQRAELKQLEAELGNTGTKTALASPTNPLAVGDHVLCRDSRMESSRWRHGVVTSIIPLTCNVDGRNSMYESYQVQKAMDWEAAIDGCDLTLGCCTEYPHKMYALEGRMARDLRVDKAVQVDCGLVARLDEASHVL